MCPKHSFFHETSLNFNQFALNSINYDYVLICQARWMLSVRVGGVYWTLKHAKAMGVPLEINFLSGSSAHLFEMSAGFTYLHFRKNWTEALGQFEQSVDYQAITGRIGYRYEKPRGGLFLRIGFTPISNYRNGDQVPIFGKGPFIPMAGIGAGWTLK